MRPLVSIITPAFNCEDTIEETYESLANQTYENWEWLVTEDVSTDITLSILENLANSDKRIKVFRNHSNQGAAVSRNNSIDKAEGEYLAFIDSDDLWHNKKLEYQVEFMNSQKIDFSFTAYDLIDAHGKSLNRTVDSRQKLSVDYIDMLKKKATMGCSTVMLRVSGFNSIQMPLIRTGQDYGLWLNLLKQGKNAYPLSRVLTSYRITPNSISRNKVKKAKRQWQIYREIEMLPFSKSAYFFCFYAFRAVFRTK
ncbi:glycosyltransferase family 2 protein [Citrobacter braakii]